MSTRCPGTEICSIIFGGEYCLLHNDPVVEHATDDEVVDSITQSGTLRCCSFVKLLHKQLVKKTVASLANQSLDTGAEATYALSVRVDTSTPSDQSTCRQNCHNFTVLILLITWLFVYLYCRSESPSQVLMIMLSWLIDVLKDVPSEKWSEIVLSYDAMCKIDGGKKATSSTSSL